jgi:hypothetical protein
MGDQKCHRARRQGWWRLHPAKYLTAGRGVASANVTPGGSATRNLYTDVFTDPSGVTVNDPDPDTPCKPAVPEPSTTFKSPETVTGPPSTSGHDNTKVPDPQPSISPLNNPSRVV